jgi:UDP-N-acetylglucosamine:LPS N-acetylglucosamine transferase
VTNSLATTSSIILLTAVSGTSGTATPSINVRSAGSFTVLVAGGSAGLGAFNYLILS